MVEMWHEVTACLAGVTDMRAGMCMDMRTGMRTGMRTDMSTDMRVDMLKDMRAGMCTDMCIDMCTDMCTDWRRVRHRHTPLERFYTPRMPSAMPMQIHFRAALSMLKK